MATTTNTNYSARSMNGIISYDDGAGGVMEGGTITANELVIDELQSKSPPNVVSLYTLSTGSINVGSSLSTVNISNLNVSNINVPLITFTVLNASTVNSETSNSSTSNSSTSNSSTSNSSTANNGTTNSSTANSSTANTGTTNSSTVNVSTLNFGTTSGTTMNMSTVNASVINTNDVQPAAAGAANLYTNIIGYNDIHIGNAVASDLYLESSTIAMREIIGQNYISATEFRSDFLNSATASATCYVYTDASVNQITIGHSAANCYINSPLLSDTSVNSSTSNSSTSNSSTSNSSTANNVSINCSNIASVGGNITTLQASTLNSTNARLVNVKTKYIEPDPSEITNDVFLYTTTTSGLVSIGTGLTTGKINMGSPTSSVNLTTLNASTLNSSSYNASTYNGTNINASYIATGELYSDYSELGNINVSSYTIDSLLPTATVNLFPALTTGTLNIATNMTSTGAITMGNAASTGSFSLSEGTINLNPKTTLNIANQLVAGTANICNSNTYRGTLNIAATANVSNASTNVLNIGSTTSITSINSWSLSLNTLGSSISIVKPLSPGYPVFVNTGTSSVNTVGYIEGGAFNTGTIAMGVDTYHNLDTVGLTSAGVYMVNFNVTLRNNSTTATTLVYYLHIQIGTSTGTSNVYEGWFNQYATLSTNAAGSPNPRLDCMHTFIYTATGVQTLSLTGQIGRTNPTNYIGTTSFFRAVRIA